MTNAAETTRNFIATMELAAHGASFGPSSRDCENRANSARWVLCHLTGSTMYGSPVTAQEARDAAKRAWPTQMPADVSEALA